MTQENTEGLMYDDANRASISARFPELKEEFVITHVEEFEGLRLYV